MCFNAGPLIGLRHFHEWMTPRYKRVTDFLRRECGCEFHMLDCDGNINALVPLWLEGGINVMFPLEAPHTDAYAISDEFGPRVPLRGYFDKRAQIAGPEAIDAELERLRPLLERGGFIPHTDHLVSPDVSWGNYQYYRRRKCEFIGKRGA
jgi:uroporphyrinogen decarboxylase